MKDLNIRNIANEAIGMLMQLADHVDAEYSEICNDTGLTGPDPVNDAQTFVRLLHKISLEINVSGLCDSGKFEQYINYGI